MTETQKRDFDQQAQTYDQPHAVERADAVVRAIRRQVRLNLKMNIMDYGAGTGLISLGLWPYVRSVKAVDSSRAMLSVLRQKVKVLGITNVTTLVCDFEEDPLPDLRFDFIVSAMTLHHIADVDALLRRLRKVLNPGGILAIADLDTEDGDFHPDNKGVRHFGFDRQEMKQLLRDAWFDGIEVSTAHRASKIVSSGEIKEFSVFLMTGIRGYGEVECADGCW